MPRVYSKKQTVSIAKPKPKKQWPGGKIEGCEIYSLLRDGEIKDIHEMAVVPYWDVPKFANREEEALWWDAERERQNNTEGR